jgi:hypothetical protein
MTPSRVDFPFSEFYSFHWVQRFLVVLRKFSTPPALITPTKGKNKKQKNKPCDTYHAPRRLSASIFFLFGFFIFIFFCNDFLVVLRKISNSLVRYALSGGDSHLLPGSSRRNHDRSHSLPGYLHVQYGRSNYFRVPFTSTAIDSRCGTFTIADILQSLTTVPRSFPMKGGCNDGSATNVHMSR